MDAGQLCLSGKMSATSLPKLGALMSSRCLTWICLLVTILPLVEQLSDPISAGLQGESVCEVLCEDAELRAFPCTFPPEVGHEQHFQPRHFGCALSGGTMRITSDSGTRKVTLKTGSFFSARALRGGSRLTSVIRPLRIS